MSCNVHFVSGSKVAIDGDAENVAQRLADGDFARFQQLQEGKRDIWINAANVLYVEAVGYDSPKAQADPESRRRAV
jgi:hypothetical protein